ncbi:2-dehydro-3-deoxyphosphogluconate aldolase / (4S)-4-hydroxy-2-oxoglutarate aldolase [Catalinimonas alkaloidigena]|uniref:2-dehydro-3-deoxyphosphogluconate aldolase / (4S)-4-hydroxy-2-oxoglutarate aldolase n=1 Tax=Catalinimonas alkaloidigena TaxID=1075417 RepID=A0A1G9HW50_9BACT|nr:bifunctional 4-hydroxy-2-oxoglutarate aldolase/2-dehydro-3-deoxy-phosphogluconate aldolase [Catalinimonas alkaloidigena]SDL16793.1 2-dehydro-3-deoxyphosphogluconate aldolase / (4S)-4-hydroxy-2-oxoglutarate aldolase [Catalinimonas alkaloidigena]
MSRHRTLQTILDEGIVAIIRQPRPDPVLPIADALFAGGVHTIEVTIGTPQALRLIEQLAAQARFCVGVGSVIDAATVDAAVRAGARFIVTPVSKQEVIARAHHHDVPVFSGAFTPGEIQAAHEWGADVVKVFPAEMFGPAYLKAVRAPLPHLRLMPTGGVTVENAGAWIRAGACALGVGSTLTDPKAIAEGNFALLTERAQQLHEQVRQARA